MDQLFEITVVQKDNADVVSVRGEVDMATSSRLQNTIERLGRPERALVVDLESVSFLDSSGLVALVQAERTLASRGIGLLVVVPESGLVRRIFEVTDVGAQLPVVDSIDAALADASPELMRQTA